MFELLAEVTGSSVDELRSSLNLGIGMVLVAALDDAAEVIRRAAESGTDAFAIGRVVRGSALRFV